MTPDLEAALHAQGAGPDVIAAVDVLTQAGYRLTVEDGMAGSFGVLDGYRPTVGPFPVLHRLVISAPWSRGPAPDELRKATR